MIYVIEFRNFSSKGPLSQAIQAAVRFQFGWEYRVLWFSLGQLHHYPAIVWTSHCEAYTLWRRAYRCTAECITVYHSVSHCTCNGFTLYGKAILLDVQSLFYRCTMYRNRSATESCDPAPGGLQRVRRMPFTDFSWLRNLFSFALSAVQNMNKIETPLKQFKNFNLKFQTSPNVLASNCFELLQILESKSDEFLVPIGDHPKNRIIRSDYVARIDRWRVRRFACLEG